MNRKTTLVAVLLLTGTMTEAMTGCGAPAQSRAPSEAVSGADIRLWKDRPALAIITREGDPNGALGLTVMTGGIALERGASVAVALAALTEGRLAARGVRDVDVIPAWDGYRVRALVAPQATSAALIEALRDALLAPVAATELEHVKKKLDALAHRPLPDPALLDATRCTGEPFGLIRNAQTPPELTAIELETWRRAAHGTGRVALAAVGTAPFTSEAALSVARAGTWPAAPSGPVGEPWPEADAQASIYEAGGELKPGGARVTLAFHSAQASRAVGAAGRLGDPRGPLASRLRALEAPAKIGELTATAHARGGCLAVVLDFAPSDLGADASTRIATAIALARQEVSVEMMDSAADDTLGRTMARRAGDPRVAAERAAWWALVKDREEKNEPPRVSLAIGFAGRRDAPPHEKSTAPSPLASIKPEIERAIQAFRDPVVEAKTKVEAGQSDLWLLLASPCGTLPEVEADAGLGAAMALASATAAGQAGDLPLQTEGWAAIDGIGVIAHGPARPNEPPLVQARRIADSAARALAADPLDLLAIAHVRAALLARAGESIEDRALATLGNAIVPGHPSWFTPQGTVDALGRSSDGSMIARATALRAGPLRLAVIANIDAAQGSAAVRAVDRWVLRRAGESRACPSPSTPPPPRPGTYTIDAASSSEAWLALPLPPRDDYARSLGEWLAAILDGDDGLLAQALGATGLARSWSARVVGPARGGALVVRVVSNQGALDGAVAQARALFDRVRQGALSEDDRMRAIAARKREELRTSLDPRGRLIALWRGAPKPVPPALEALRTFAGATLHDEALIIVAARPPRPVKSP